MTSLADVFACKSGAQGCSVGHSSDWITPCTGQTIVQKRTQHPGRLSQPSVLSNVEKKDAALFVKQLKKKVGHGVCDMKFKYFWVFVASEAGSSGLMPEREVLYSQPGEDCRWGGISALIRQSGGLTWPALSVSSFSCFRPSHLKSSHTGSVMLPSFLIFLHYIN